MFIKKLFFSLIVIYFLKSLPLSQQAYLNIPML